MEEKYCQSCGMPMGENEKYGSDKGGSISEDYCSYCYNDGDFTSNSTMDEMIEICLPHMVGIDGMTEESARKMMNEFFPDLKRWNVG